MQITKESMELLLRFLERVIKIRVDQVTQLCDDKEQVNVIRFVGEPIYFRYVLVLHIIL